MTIVEVKMDSSPRALRERLLRKNTKEDLARALISIQQRIELETNIPRPSVAWDVNEIIFQMLR